MHQREFLRFISTRDWQTGLSANLAHSLFLWSPWAKNGFYIFKWLRKKEKKKKKKRGAGEGEGRGQKHVTEPRSILQSFKLSGPLQEKLSAPGLVHPMELFILPASSTFTSCRPLRHTMPREFGDPAAERLQDDLSTLGSVGDGTPGPHSPQHHLHRGRRGCITPTATTTLARGDLSDSLVKHSSLVY